MSLENWYRKKHRWDVPMGESLANISLGMESQRWHIILHWKSVIAWRNCGIREPLRRKSHDLWSVAIHDQPRVHRNRTDGEYHAAQAQREAQRRRRERPLVRKMEEPESTRPSVRGWRRNGRRNRSRVGCGSKIPTAAFRRKRSTPGSSRMMNASTGNRFCGAAGSVQTTGKMPPRPGMPRIDKRPEVIEERLRLGDFEGDTVLGPAGTGGLATMVDRKSRFTIITKVKTKNADHVHERIKQRMKELDEERRHSITLDNGTEFAAATVLKSTWALRYTLLIRAVRISAVRTRIPMA